MKKLNILLVLFVVLFVSCEMEEEDSTDPTDLITIESSRSFVTANGQDVIVFTITLNPLMDSMVGVKVESNFGKLDSTSATLASSTNSSITTFTDHNIITIYLLADTSLQVSQLQLQVSVLHLTQTWTCPIRRSFPTDLLIEVSDDTLASNDSIDINVTLDTDSGYVTHGTKVYFSVTPDTSGANAFINPYAFSETNIATAKLISIGTQTGTLTLSAFVVNDYGDTISRQRQVIRQ